MFGSVWIHTWNMFLSSRWEECRRGHAPQQPCHVLSCVWMHSDLCTCICFMSQVICWCHSSTQTMNRKKFHHVKLLLEQTFCIHVWTYLTDVLLFFFKMRYTCVLRNNVCTICMYTLLYIGIHVLAIILVHAHTHTYKHTVSLSCKRTELGKKLCIYV